MKRTAEYYDALLLQYEQTVEDDLPPPAEYKRLSDLADAYFIEPPPGTDLTGKPIEVPKEALDFLQAIDRRQKVREQFGCGGQT